jgi:hypothetical protein
MLVEYKSKTNAGVGLGVICMTLARLLIADDAAAYLQIVRYIAISAGYILFLAGCGFYAIGKGYHWAWGLSGVVTIPGLIVLYFLPDRHPELKGSDLIEKAPMARIDRDFYANPKWLQDWQSENTWCDTCEQADLGMHSPKEYEEGGRTFVSGLCNNCGNVVTSEVLTIDVDE